MWVEFKNIKVIKIVGGKLVQISHDFSFSSRCQGPKVYLYVSLQRSTQLSVCQVS